jgi:hypothetical protein
VLALFDAIRPDEILPYLAYRNIFAYLVYAPSFQNDDGKADDGYYDNSDLAVTYLSPSKQEEKNYMLIIWSTLLGLSLALLIEAILVLRDHNTDRNNNPS